MIINAFTTNSDTALKNKSYAYFSIC